MAQDEVKLQLPLIDNTQSIGNMVLKKQVVNVANGVKIKNALACRNGSMFILIENTGGSAGTVTLKRGNSYPNKCLGDMVIAVEVGVNVIQLQDPSRFENRDGSVCIDFSVGFTGFIYAIGKRVGILPVEFQ